MQSDRPTGDVSENGVWSAVVPRTMAGERLDVFLSSAFKDGGLSRSKIQSLIKSGSASVDGEVARKPKLKLSGGETIALTVDLPSAELAPEDAPLDVIHADEHLVVVNKPWGLTVHPAPAQPNGTLVNRLAHHFPAIMSMEGERPGIVHRIDKDTSGLLLVALDEKTRLALSAAFAGRDVDKDYLAIVHGVPQDESSGRQTGTIDAPIGRDPKSKTKMAVVDKGGREALSEWEVLWSSPDGHASLVRVHIYTGRTHQIRVHMAHIGHPLMGDAIYGARQHKEWLRDSGHDASLAPRQMLHAWRLGFTHPETEQDMRFVLEPPEDFRRLLFTLARTTVRVGVVGMPGCGKSALSGFLREAGVPVFSADDAVAALYEHGEDGWTLVRRRFGEEFAPDGEPVAKGRLFAGMRQSEDFRREVLDIVHPLVQHRLEEFWAQHADAPVAVAEVPLLVEGGWDERGIVDMVVGVHCPEAVRRGRLEDRGWDEATMAALEAWQWSEADKLARCAHVVDNSGTLDDLHAEAQRLLQRIDADRRADEEREHQRIMALWSGDKDASAGADATAS